MTLIDCLAKDQCQGKLKKKRSWWIKLLKRRRADGTRI